MTSIRSELPRGLETISATTVGAKLSPGSLFGQYFGLVVSVTLTVLVITDVVDLGPLKVFMVLAMLAGVVTLLLVAMGSHSYQLMIDAHGVHSHVFGRTASVEWKAITAIEVVGVGMRRSVRISARDGFTKNGRTLARKSLLISGGLNVSVPDLHRYLVERSQRRR